MARQFSLSAKSASDKNGSSGMSRQVESSRGYLAAKELVYDAIMQRATDIHLEPQEHEVAIRIRVDGTMVPAESFDKETGNAVTNVFKVLGALDITERRRAQDGSFGAILSARQIDFRLATQGTRFGEKLSIRVLDQANAVADLGKLGFPKRLQEKVEKLINEPHGLLLCCGPTGAGKSTTLYAALNTIDRYHRNVITIEDPVEYKIPGINQIEINTKAGQSFANSLRSILSPGPRRGDGGRNSGCGNGHHRLPGGQYRTHGVLDLARQRHRDGTLPFARTGRGTVHGGQQRFGPDRATTRTATLSGMPPGVSS